MILYNFAFLIPPQNTRFAYPRMFIPKVVTPGEWKYIDNQKTVGRDYQKN